MGFLLGGKTPKQPEVVKTSPVADDKQVKAEASSNAAAEEAARRVRQQQASLLATAGGNAGVTSAAPTSGSNAYGKTLLGQ